MEKVLGKIKFDTRVEHAKAYSIKSSYLTFKCQLYGGKLQVSSYENMYRRAKNATRYKRSSRAFQNCMRGKAHKNGQSTEAKAMCP